MNTDALARSIVGCPDGTNLVKQELSALCVKSTVAEWSI